MFMASCTFALLDPDWPRNVMFFADFQEKASPQALFSIIPNRAPLVFNERFSRV
jgi:hypothetical protein